MTLSHVHLTSRLGDQVDTWRSVSPEQVTGVKMKQMFWLSSSKLTLLILLLSALIDGRSQHWRAHIHQTKASRDEWTSPLSNVHHLLKDCPAAATVFILQLHRLIHCGRDSVSNYDPVANQSESGSAEREGAGGGDRKTGLLSTHVHAPRAHTHTEPCQLSAATLSPTMKDHGKVFTHCNGLTLGSIGQYWSTNQISDGFIHYRPGLERITARAARLFLQRQFKSNRVQKKIKNKNKVLFLLLLPALTPPLLAPPPTR